MKILDDYMQSLRQLYVKAVIEIYGEIFTPKFFNITIQDMCDIFSILAYIWISMLDLIVDILSWSCWSLHCENHNI